MEATTATGFPPLSLQMYWYGHSMTTVVAYIWCNVVCKLHQPSCLAVKAQRSSPVTSINRKKTTKYSSKSQIALFIAYFLFLIVLGVRISQLFPKVCSRTAVKVVGGPKPHELHSDIPFPFEPPIPRVGANLPWDQLL